MGRWQDIAIKKNKTDAARAKVFTKIGREIAVAIKTGGGANPETNSKLRDAIAKAKANNVPNDNINRIIKKAENDATAGNYEDIIYEGYGPCGVAIIVEASTDNRNRTAAEMRHYFDKFGGNLGQAGSVSFMFQRFGVIDLEKGEGFDEDEMTLFALDNGAEDVIIGEEACRILVGISGFQVMVAALQDGGYGLISSEIQYVPTTESEISDENDRANMERLLGMIEANDDVMNVYTNWMG